jgi:acyl carrier protein phosphodiesterase
MRVQDWLGSYRNVAAIGNALDRMSARIARANPLRGSVAELIRHYDSFEADFLEFIPAALAFAAEHRASRLERFAPGLQLLVVQR